MNILSFVVEVVRKWVPMETTEKAQLFDELYVDFNEVKISDKQSTPEEIKAIERKFKEGKISYKIKYFLKENTKGPWARLGIALLFIPASAWVRDLIDPPPAERKYID